MCDLHYHLSYCHLVDVSAHFTLCRLAYFVYDRFLNKSPCTVPRQLDEASCPPEGMHNIADYPLYYDPLYFPHEHSSVFETPENFVAWLSRSLNSHHIHCADCDLEFVGCVALVDTHLNIFHGLS